MKSEIFLWDWKEQPPLVDIVRAAQRIKGAKLWWADEGGDTNILIVAKDKATAKRRYSQWNKAAGGEADAEIYPWEES